MKNYFSIVLLAVFVSLQGCYKDDTSGPYKKLSDISVDLGFADRSVIELDMHDSYTFEPQVSQVGDLPLSYEWQVNYEVVSTDETFTYVGSRLGTFPARLKVSNEDGSTFKEFTIRVNSQYEEGLIVLAADDSEEGVLNFIPKFAGQLLSETGIDRVDVNSFGKSNPDLTLGRKPTDVAVRQLQVFVSSEEEGISMLNYRTFELEGTVRSPDFPDFKPVIMNIPDNTARTALILTRSGRIFSLATMEYIISNYAASNGVVPLMKTQYTENINYTNNFFWEPSASRLWNFRNQAKNTGTHLAGQELLTFLVAGKRCYVLTRSMSNPNQVTRTVYGEDLYAFDASYREYFDVREQETFINNQVTIDPSSVTLLVDFYQKLVYANGNQIYQWFYPTTNLPSTPHITLDIPGVVTAMEKDPENKELYVGVYDAHASGKKGSIVVYDLDSGRKKVTYANVVDRPVRLFFKHRK